MHIAYRISYIIVWRIEVIIVELKKIGQDNINNGTTLQLRAIIN